MLRWEAVNLLLVMASTQLYTPTATAAAGAHPFTAALLAQHELVPGLLQVWPEALVGAPACPSGSLHDG